jgi:hypothetical protein
MPKSRSPRCAHRTTGPRDACGRWHQTQIERAAARASAGRAINTAGRRRATGGPTQPRGTNLHTRTRSTLPAPPPHTHAHKPQTHRQNRHTPTHTQNQTRAGARARKWTCRRKSR